MAAMAGRGWMQPPSSSALICALSGNPLLSSGRLGCAARSFIRPLRSVPPAMNASWGSGAWAAAAVAGSSALESVKGSMAQPLLAPLQSFDVGDPLTRLHRRQGHARENAPALDVDGAGSAFAPIAGFLRTGQGQFLTQRIEQRRARLDRDGVNPAVDRQAHVHARVVVRDDVLGGLTCARRPRFHRVAFRLAPSRTSSLCGAERDALATSCLSR